MYEGKKKKLKSTNKWALMKSAFERLTERQLIETIFPLAKCSLLAVEMLQSPKSVCDPVCDPAELLVAAKWGKTQTGSNLPFVVRLTDRW